MRLPSLPRESVLRLAWPLVLSFTMRSLFSFVDTAFAATIGDEAVAAIGLSFPLEFLLIAFWVGTSTGLTSLLSRAMGAHEGERFAQVLATTKRIVAVLIPVFVAIGLGVWILTPLLVREGPGLPGLDAETARLFRIYGTVIVAGSAVTSFWSILPDSIVKAHHDTKATMWAGIWSNLLNVTLNAVFVFVFGWGIFGIAFSTVIGRFGGLIYAQRMAAAHERRRLAAGLDTVAGTYDRPARALAVLAVPAALTYVLMSLEATVINLLLARFPHPTEAIAAYAIYYRFAMFFVMPLIATSVALLPFTGRLWGRRDVAGIRRAFREVSWTAFLYVTLFVGPLTLVAGAALVAPLAESPLTRELASFAVLLVPLTCLASLGFFACRPIFEGMQLGHPGLVVAIVRYVVLTTPCALGGAALARAAGLTAFHGAIGGVIVATALSSILFVAWMRRQLDRVEREAAAEA